MVIIDPRDIDTRILDNLDQRNKKNGYKVE